MMNVLRNWVSKSRERSGQALIEFMFVAFILLFMLFGMIDFCRAISTRQVLINLSRESANLAARGTGSTPAETMSNAIAAVIAGANPLDINAHGRVIITAVFNSNGNYVVTDQIAEGGLNGVLSKISPSGATGSAATVPNYTVQVPQSNQTMFVSEVFYSFQPATPIGQILNFTMTNALYDAAYF